MWGSVDERVILAIGESADANAQRPEGDQAGTNMLMCLLANRVCPLGRLGWQPWVHQKQRRRPVTCTNSVSEGGLEPSAPPILVERESGRNRGLTCGVRENKRPDANPCAPLPRIGATTGGTDDLDPAPRNNLLFGEAEPETTYDLTSKRTPALRAALAGGLSRMARVAPSRSASSR